MGDNLFVEEVGKRARVLREAPGINLDIPISSYINSRIAGSFRPELHKMVDLLVMDELQQSHFRASDAQSRIRLALESFAKAEDAVFGRVRHGHYKSRSVIAYIAAAVWALVFFGAFFMRDPDGSYPFRGMPGLFLAATGFAFVAAVVVMGRRNGSKSASLKSYLASKDAGLAAGIKRAEHELADDINEIRDFTRAVDLAIISASENSIVVDTYNKLKKRDKLNEIDELQAEHDRAERKASEAFLRANAPRQRIQSSNVYEVYITSARSDHSIYMAEAQLKRRQIEQAKRELD